MSTNKPQIGYVSQHLPPNDREALVRAALTPIPTRDPKARIKAIDATTAQVQARNPELFHINEATGRIMSAARHLKQLCTEPTHQNHPLTPGAGMSWRAPTEPTTSTARPALPPGVASNTACAAALAPPCGRCTETSLQMLSSTMIALAIARFFP